MSVCMPMSTVCVCVCVHWTGCNLQSEHGDSQRGRTQGSHQAELAVPGTCPGKRPDVTRIKTTHTPCQTAAGVRNGRMDGGRTGKLFKKEKDGKENNDRTTRYEVMENDVKKTNKMGGRCSLWLPGNSTPGPTQLLELNTH